ncbi:hypothetical protein PInf_002916 [Phytophthora infestans]|nr:hypothetical protein PInf_002916 [Phytophthora infestans]
MDAEFAFRNPYGFLPGLLYGLLPFNGVLSLMYGALDVYFLVLIYRHRQSVVGTHYSCFAYCCWQLVRKLSRASVFSGMLNDSGVPVCCPYPDSVLFSTFVKVLAGMVARIATTLVSLGYGIVRMQISWPEVFVVSGLGVCYFIAVGALENLAAFGQTAKLQIYTSLNRILVAYLMTSFILMAIEGAM